MALDTPNVCFYHLHFLFHELIISVFINFNNNKIITDFDIVLNNVVLGDLYETIDIGIVQVLNKQNFEPILMIGLHGRC